MFSATDHNILLWTKRSIQNSSFCIYLFSIHTFIYHLFLIFNNQCSSSASTLSTLYHNQVCISIIFEITVIIALVNLCLSFPCTLKHSYLDRETSLILKNIAGKPSHLLTKVTPPFACFLFLSLHVFGSCVHRKTFNLSLYSSSQT